MVGNVQLDRIAQKIQEALRENYDVLLRTPPGTGKSSHIRVWAVETLKKHGGAILYVVPTLDLAKEVEERIVGVDAAVIEGRNPENCNRFREVEKAVKLGYPANLICKLCLNEAECKFKRNLKRAFESGARLVIATQKSYPLVFQERRGLKAVIFDDRVLDLVQTEKVGLEDVRAMCIKLNLEGFYDDLDRCLRKIEGSSKDMRITVIGSRPFEWQNERRPTIWEIFERFGLEAQRRRAELEKVFSFLPSNDTLYSWFEKGLSLKAYEFLRRLLTGEAYIQILKSGVSFGYCTLPSIPPEPRLVLADYDLTENLARKIFGRTFLVVEASLPLNAPVYHVKNHYAKTSVKKDPKKLKRLASITQSILEAHSGNFLIFAHKDFLDDLKSLVIPPPHIKQLDWANHFGVVSRGLNAYKDYDGIIILLQPQKNPIAFWDLAYALDLSGEEVVALIEHQACAEVVQEVCRLRPHRREKPPAIWLVGKFFDSLPNYLRSKFLKGSRQKKLQLARELARILLETFGFVCKTMLEEVGVGDEHVPESEVRLRGWKRVAEVYPRKVYELATKVKSFQQENRISILLSMEEGSLPSADKYLYISSEGCSGPPAKRLKKLAILNEGDFAAFQPLIKALCTLSIRFKTDAWWAKILKQIDADRFEFELRREDKGRWRKSTALGSPDAFRSFFESLGLWGTRVRFPERRAGDE